MPDSGRRPELIFTGSRAAAPGAGGQNRNLGGDYGGWYPRQCKLPARIPPPGRFLFLSSFPSLFRRPASSRCLRSRCVIPLQLAHQADGVLIRVGQERHPQIVLLHARHQVRLLQELYAFGHQG